MRNGIYEYGIPFPGTAHCRSGGGRRVVSRAINEIARSQFGEINCYPGEPGNRCHPIALFFALHGQLRKGKGHYNCAQILEEMIRHMQGRCPGATRHAVLILDAWWHDHYEKWRANIETLKRDGMSIEAYLIGAGGWVAPLPV